MPRKISRRAALISLGTFGAALLAATGRFAALFKALRRIITPAPMPTIISRANWGAAPPNHDAPNEYGVTDDATDPAWYVYRQPITEIYHTVAVHHTAALLVSSETMRDVQNLHLNVNGWADVGYHYGIDHSGLIYEGRDIHVRGASVAGHNTGVIGVVLMGDFQIDQPLDVQLASLQTLVNWLAEQYPLTHLAAHREFNPETLCPGDHLMAHLDAVAQAADLQRGTGG